VLPRHGRIVGRGGQAAVVMSEVNSTIRRLTCPDPLSATETDAGSLPDGYVIEFAWEPVDL
jgi:hypothetical protein